MLFPVSPSLMFALGRLPLPISRLAVPRPLSPHHHAASRSSTLFVPPPAERHPYPSLLGLLILFHLTVSSAAARPQRQVAQPARESPLAVCVRASAYPPPPPLRGHSAPPLAARQRAPTLARTAKHAHWPSPSTPKLRRAETPLQLSAPVDRARARSAREPAPQAGHSRLTRTVTLLAGALGAHQAPPRCLAQIGDDRALTSGKRLQSPRRPRRRRRRPSRRARRPVARGSVRAGTRRRRLSPTTSRRLNKMELRPLLTRRRPTPR